MNSYQEQTPWHFLFSTILSGDTRRPHCGTTGLQLFCSRYYFRVLSPFLHDLSHSKTQRLPTLETFLAAFLLLPQNWALVKALTRGDLATRASRRIIHYEESKLHLESVKELLGKGLIFWNGPPRAEGRGRGCPCFISKVWGGLKAVPVLLFSPFFPACETDSCILGSCVMTVP